MSYDSAKQINIDWVFSGWYVDNTPETSLSDKFSPYLRNARLDWMAIISRPWHSLLTTLTSGDYPRGISSYLRTLSSNDRILVRHNTDATHKLYTITAAWVATSILTAADIASDNRMTFQNVWDVIYCMNWSDFFGKLNGTTYTVPSTWIASFAPSFSVVFNSSHWASGWATNPNKVYKSVWNNYEDFSSTGSDQFTFWETITGLATNSEALFYFTKNTISVTWVSDIQDIGWSINYTTRGLQVKEWSVNHSSIVSAGNNIYCVTPSNKIIRVTKWQNVDWFEVYELSERQNAWISWIMNSLDIDQTDSFGYFLQKENIIKWYFKSAWSTFNDICIVYDIIHDSFLVDTNCFFYGWINFKWYYYTISNIEPKVYSDEYGYDDEDSAISFRYETKYFDLWIPGIKKELWESGTYVAINLLAQLIQSIVIDGNTVDTKQIDSDNIPISTGWIWTAEIWTYEIWSGEEFSWIDTMYNVAIRRTKWNLQKKWYKIKFIYTNDTLSGRVRLENLWMRIEVLPMEANNLTT